MLFFVLFGRGVLVYFLEENIQLYTTDLNLVFLVSLIESFGYIVGSFMSVFIRHRIEKRLPIF